MPVGRDGAWFAGFVDGEGCFALGLTRSRTGRAQIVPNLPIKREGR
ncbi:MAG TPA: hypothetical protein VF192_01255 [Longimicrobiales bacterium]